MTADLTPLFYVSHDDDGRILQQGLEASNMIDAAIAGGEKRVITAFLNLFDMSNSNYVDVTTNPPSVKKRPIFPGSFDKSTVMPKQEATIKNVPACKVSFSGPVTGVQDHSNGDLSIGFTYPGQYMITFEAWPYMPVSLPLNVITQTANTATATANATVKV